VTTKRKQETEKKNRQIEKGKRKEVRERRRVAKVQLEGQWKVVRQAHKKVVEKWQEECKQLQARDTKVKDLPKKPWLMKKGDLTKEMGLGEESDNEEGDEDC
jgi:hypothetical protein